MNVSKRDAQRIFTKLKVVPKRSTHHVAGFLVVDGVRVLALHYSRGRGDMAGRSGHHFRRSLLLNIEEFTRLRDCPMSREEYIALLRTRVSFDEG